MVLLFVPGLQPRWWCHVTSSPPSVNGKFMKNNLNNWCHSRNSIYRSYNTHKHRSLFSRKSAALRTCCETGFEIGKRMVFRYIRL